LQLDVYHPSPITIYDAPEDVVDYSVSTDKAHPFPYLIAPSQYAAQEIDPIQCTASIGTVSVGVIDVPTLSGDQTTGWMTARVFDLQGRRCVLRRWVDEATGWVVIADGPAGAPSLDQTYAAYRWTIRDTRDVERKLTAFENGGSASIVPRGAVYGFGSYLDDYDGIQYLLPPTLEHPVVGHYETAEEGGLGLTVGLVNFASTIAAADDDGLRRLKIDDPGWDAVTLMEIATNVWASRYCDIVWRKVGDLEWNISRPTSPGFFRQPTVGSTDVTNPDDPTKLMRILDYVTLFTDTEIPFGFPTTSCDVELVVRYRGPATSDYPYYLEGTLGEVLKNVYDGKYSLVPIDGITGFLYDPGSLDARISIFLTRIRYDQAAFNAMTQQVRYRATSPVADVRAWAETNLYAPSGFIPALNSDAEISPILRTRPEGLDAITLVDAIVVPSPQWNLGEVTVSEVEYDWPRYFIPDPFSGISVEPDGLASRDVILDFDDPEDALRYGDQPQVYDASAFAAVGDKNGVELPGQPEQASLFAQAANFDVLSRFHAGAQVIQVNVARAAVPFVRVGSWLPWVLSWFPDRNSGLRGSTVMAAQVIGILDDDCAWRTLTLQEDGGLGSVVGQPGFVSSARVVGDDQSSGFVAGAVVISDVVE
jgi:hypothetical protein